jgi:hypothetical protein
VLLASMFLSASIHFTVLHLRVNGPADILTPGPPGMDEQGAAIEVVQIRVGEVATLVAMEPTPSDPPPIEPTTSAAPAEASADMPVHPRSSRAPFDPAGSDTRLWAGSMVDWAPSIESARSARAISDSAVHEWNASGMRIGPLRLGLKSCDSFLTCRLDFVRTSDLNERFGRMREIENQAALKTMYRDRQEALKLRRRTKKPN